MRPVQRLWFKCLLCGTSYSRRPKEVSRKGRRTIYCSIKCQDEGMKRRRILECQTCGNSFERKLCDIRRRESNGWCSWRCFRSFQKRYRKSYPKTGGRHIHRIVAEKMLGRPLRSGEIVHHKDRNRLNYSRRNLEVLKSLSEHTRLHMKGIPKTKTHRRNMSIGAKRARRERAKSCQR